MQLNDGVWVETEEEKQTRELTEKYHAVLCSGLGVDVLVDILAMCHFGATLDIENKHQIAEHNVGVAILAKCGIFGSESMLEVVRALCSITRRT